MEDLLALKIRASLLNKKQLQKMLTSSYVKKYIEINKRVLFLWQKYTSKAPFYPTSYFPDFPTSVA